MQHINKARQMTQYRQSMTNDTV